MARCGCSAGGCSCRILPLLTDCVHVDVTGSGISDDPYFVSASIPLDANLSNLLTCSADGLLAAVLLTVDIESCLAVSGTGAPGDPFILGTTLHQDDLAPFSKTGILAAPYTGVSRFRFPFDATLLGVTAAVNTAPTGADIILDVNKNGSTIYTVSTKPTIGSGNFDTGGVEIVPDVTAIAFGDYLTVDVDQIGSTIAGADLTLLVHYTRLVTCPVGL